ncbi:BSD domain-containing family protein [Striga asiatica]|uniref:BSD domain-containing family protein n=1 Tax=Striga asiatica TaxID=4170 RepID=A0A5A7RBP7_STRAF|nr:BSD domain-containing family protein [Striga asiatica]
MAWLARSIANSLKFDDDEDDDDVNAVRKPEPKQSDSPESRDDDVTSPTSTSRGVKEDLSELSKTLTRQFWGVASFLAPPPQPEPKSDSGVSELDQGSILGIRSDFAEIGGRFKSGISRLSNNINVSEFTKMATNLLQLESDDENDGIGNNRESFESFGEGAVGLTEKVVAFVRDITMHQETWLDFPLPENVDFDMTNAQQEHALAVERLAPRLAAVRMELCPGYMSESCFWLIYFLLLHPRLDKQEAELLSTPQVLKARALLGHELKNKNTTESGSFYGKKSPGPEEIDISHNEEPLSVMPENLPNKAANINAGTSAAPEIVKDPIERNESKTVNRPITQENETGQVNEQYINKSSSSTISIDEDENDADDWLKEETLDAGDPIGKNIPIENEDDVSFSDLEDDDDGDVPASYRKSNYSSDKDSRDWVRC